MKKIQWLTVLLISLVTISAYAQKSDSLKQQQTDSATQNPIVPGLQSPDLTERFDFTDENAVIVQPDEVPPALGKTLLLEPYRGWESGKLYRHLATNEYKLEIIGDASVRTFYFDKNGERIVE